MIESRFQTNARRRRARRVRRFLRRRPRSAVCPPAASSAPQPLIAHLRGADSTSTRPRPPAVTATRQFAKRQRTWFRNRMPDWTRIDPGPSGTSGTLTNGRNPENIRMVSRCFQDALEDRAKPLLTHEQSARRQRSARYWLRSRSVQRTADLVAVLGRRLRPHQLAVEQPGPLAALVEAEAAASPPTVGSASSAATASSSAGTPSPVSAEITAHPRRPRRDLPQRLGLVRRRAGRSCSRPRSSAPAPSSSMPSSARIARTSSRLGLALGMGDVAHVQDQVGLEHLLERGAEGRDQLVRQVGDEADGVGQDRPPPVRQRRARASSDRAWRTACPWPAPRSRSAG